MNSYPLGIIEKLLQTEYLSPATKAAIEPRLHTSQAGPAYFDENSFRILTIICNHLLALSGDYPANNIALEIDARLAAGRSNGWRYHRMPDDRIVYHQAFRGIQEAAEIMYGFSFENLPAEQQVALLLQIQLGEVKGETWLQLSAKLFFEELLTEVTEIFYSYPYAQNEIGYVGMADMHGWKNIGLDEHEDPEPTESKSGKSL